MALELTRRPAPALDWGREFMPLRTMMDRLLVSAFTPSFWGDGFRLANVAGVSSFGMDVYESDDAYIVHCLLPGIDPDKVTVSMQDNVLTIGGESQRIAPENARLICTEIGYGKFQRRLILDSAVDASKAEAAYLDGILTVTLPKAETARPRPIKVHAKAA